MIYVKEEFQGGEQGIVTEYTIRGNLLGIFPLLIRGFMKRLSALISIRMIRS